MKALLSLILSSLALLPLSANAAGFFIQEQSVSGLGAAFAGETAAARDASTIFFNPAGLTQLKQREIQFGTHFLLPDSELTNTGSTATIAGVPSAISGETTNNPYKLSPVPNFYAAMPVMNNELWIGYGLSAPFGLGNNYDQTVFSRYDSTKTHLKAINHSLVAAYKANDIISIGGGIDIQQANAKLNRNVLITSVGPVLVDAETSVKGDDISLGWNAGILIKPRDDLNIGLHYRSAIDHTLEGDVRTGTPSTVTSVAGTADLNLPDIASLGVAWDVTPQWKLLAGTTWFGWSNFEEIRVKRAGQPDDVTTQGYKNTVAFNVGGEYKYSDDWTFRAGMQYDPTPTVDEFRSSRTPDGDRTWISVGGTHQLNKNLSLDLAATQIFIADETINVTRPGALPGRSTNIRAETEGSVSIVGVAFKYRF
jgi:long-chain fatty acid transport protein